MQVADFRAESLLADRLGVKTWRGVRDKSLQAVVIKLAGPRPGALLRLSHEAEVLGRLAHPRIPRFHFVGPSRDGLALVADFVSGPTLQDRLRNGPLPWRVAAELARQALEVLQAAHAAGVLHRDLKPSNLVCHREGLWLTDWGLSRNQWLQAPLCDLPASTVHYIAPEMAGTLRRGVTEASDLYALGIVVFECLAGHPPFTGTTVSEVLHQHLCSSVPRVGGPPELDVILQRLLAKEPHERYNDASQASEDFGRLLVGEALGPRSPRAFMAEPPLVGREPDMAWLRGTLRGGRLVLLEAEPGGGKSRLLDELGRQAARDGYRVLQGQALSRPQAAPLQLFAGISQDLGCSGPEDDGPGRVARKLVTLLGTTATPERPLLILLDDIQWADGLSLSCLAHLDRTGLPPGVAIVAACREGELPVQLPRSLLLKLSPLTPEQARQFLPDELSEATRAHLIELSRGNPFLLLEGLRGGADLHSASLLLTRMAGLHPATSQIMKAAAVLGRHFEVRLLTLMLGQPVHEGLEEARRERILWAGPSGEDFAFSHDRLREACLAQLAPAELERWHGLAAEAYAGSSPDAAASLAHHLSAAGRAREAHPHAMRAARESRAAFDFETAELHYRLAEAGALDLLPALDGLAEMLYLQGRYAEAADCFSRAAEVAGGVEENARLSIRWSMSLYRSGRETRAMEILRDLLPRLGQPVPRLLSSALRHLAQRLGGRFSLPAYPEQAILALSELSEISARCGRMEVAVASLLRAGELAERAPESLAALRARVDMVTVLAYVPVLAPALCQQVDRLLPLVEAVEDRFYQVRLTSRLIVPLLSTQPLEVVRERHSFLHDMTRVGAHVDYFVSCFLYGQALCNGGCFDELRALADRLRGLSPSIDNVFARSIALAVEALAYGGEVEADRLLAECARPPLSHPLAELTLRLATGLWLLRQARFREAARLLSRPSEAKLPVVAAPVASLAAAAWRLVAEELECPPIERHRAYRQAERLARKSLWLARLGWAPAQAGAWRELGLLSAARGDFRRAEKCFRQSLCRAEELGYRYQHALTRLERELLAQARGLPARPADVRSELGAMGAYWYLSPGPDHPERIPIALLDRFDQSVSWGRRLAETMDPDEIDRVLLEAAVTLLRAEAGLLLSWPEQTILLGPSQPISRSTVARAVASGRAVTAGEKVTDLTGTRSVLAAPVQVGGRTRACLYLTHQLVSGLFSEEELRLADFLTCLAGGALDNALCLGERQKTRDALQLNRERYRTLFETADVGLAVLGEQDRVVEANPKLLEMLGPILGRVWSNLVIEPDRAQCQRGGECELRFLRPDGTLLWGLCTVTPLGSSRVASLSDITPRRLEGLSRFVEEERRLLSSELHDGLSGDLVALYVKVQEGADLEGCSALSQRLLTEASRLVRSLRSPAGLGVELGDALRSLAAPGVRLELVIDPPELPSTGLAGASAYRIVQEGVRNAMRHGKATFIKITLTLAEGVLVGAVEDDGTGFRPEEVPHTGSRHLGLRSIRFRAELLGGEARILSLPGQGTRILFRLPCQEKQ